MASLQSEDREAALVRLLDIYNVAESKRPALKAKIHIEIARVTRLLWAEHGTSGVLATLSAPLFLKNVHADDIAPDGSVQTKTIRAIDPALLRAIAVYISMRKARRRDLGDAAGLHFVFHHPSKRLPTKKQIDLLRRVHRTHQRMRAKKPR